MTRAVVLAIALAPWLCLLPIGGAFAVIAQAIVVAAAFHGAGLVVVQACRRTLHPLVAVQCGIAAVIALSGIAIALNLFTLAFQTVLLFGLAAVHTSVIGLRFAGLRESLDQLGATRRIWLVPAAILVGLAIVQILGAAGDLGARPFDDDGNVLAQLQRLRDTGTLADPIGHARASQLGGQLAFDAFAVAASDLHLVRLGEALAFVLAIALAIHRTRSQEQARRIWALLVVIVAATFAYVPDDLATCWTALGLILALEILLADDAPALLIGSVGGALIALRLELAPLAGVALVTSWWPRRGIHARTIGLAAGLLATITPLAIVRARAWSSVSAGSHALVLPARGSLAIELAVTVAIGLAAIPLVRLLVRDRALQWLALGGALSLAGIVGQLTGDRHYSTRFVWPIMFAIAFVLVGELARAKRFAITAMMVSFVLATLVYEGRAATGRLRLTRRYLELATNIEYVRHVADAPVTGGYAELLARIPAGATVGIWIERPERVDYSHHRIFDLRTRRGARVRAKLAARLQYLLVETEDRATKDLDALGPVIATSPGLRLVAVQP